MADQRGLDRALARIFPIINEHQAQNLIAQGGVRGNARAFGNYNYNLITMPRIAGPWRGEVFRVPRRQPPPPRSLLNHQLNNIWARLPRTPMASPPLQRRAGVRGGSPQRATMTTNSNNNGNVTSRRRQAPLEGTNSSKPPPPPPPPVKIAVALSPMQEKRIQRNVAQKVKQMTPQIQYTPANAEASDKMMNNYRQELASLQAKADRNRDEKNREALEKLFSRAVRVVSATRRAGLGLARGIGGAGLGLVRGIGGAGLSLARGASMAGGGTKAAAIGVAKKLKKFANIEMELSEALYKQIEAKEAEAAAKKAANAKAAAEVVAKKAANAKAAAEKALKKAAANKTARRAGLIWRAKSRKSAATKAMNKAANMLNEQNKRAEEAERAANNARFRAIIANMAAESNARFAKSLRPLTANQKAQQAANAAKRAELAAASKALREIEKKKVNAALKRAIANGNVEAIKRMRTSALFRETPAGPGRPLFKRNNKQDKVFSNALAKAQKVAAAKRAGNIARQGGAKRFAEKAAANNARRQAAVRIMQEQERRRGTAIQSPPRRPVTNNGPQVEKKRQQNVVYSTGGGRVGAR